MPVTDRNPGFGDGGVDDLPRTLRRERDAQQRAQQTRVVPPAPSGMPVGDYGYAGDDGLQPAIVKAIKVPFFSLMLFFVKAVLAAIPAMLLILGILWGLGHVLMTYFPWLVKVQILIHVPK